ncbi:MAG: PAS domain S-box protein [Candidatus Heimdallarchaeota archaeon]|nr:PAS domain S-box protein [Candidatus Heimdallarchaeota archaeon]MCK4770723.1 PAS domain S-box protein [Candidatus Heimdallarchaeota archaeon]
MTSKSIQFNSKLSDFSKFGDEEIINILHIDDNESFLKITKHYIDRISSGKYRIDYLINPKKVLNQLKIKDYDIIISDFQMPKLNGLQLLEKLREEGYFLPFIMFTGKGREEVVIQALNLGADYYIKKGFDAFSQYTELYHVIKNVITSRRMEKALLESERRYRELVETMNEGLIVVDSDYFITFTNEKFCSMLRREKGDIVGGKIPDFLTASSKTTFFENISKQNEARIESYELSWKRIDQDESITLVSPKPILNKDGKIKGYIYVLTEITDRKRAEDELKKEKNTFQKYLDISDVMFLVLNKNGEIQLINKKGSEILQCREEEILGLNWFDTIIPEKNREEMKRVFHNIIEGKEESYRYYENPIVNFLGEERIIAWHNTLIYDENNEITGTLSSGEDITEKKKIEELIRKQNEFFNTVVESLPHPFMVINTDDYSIALANSEVYDGVLKNGLKCYELTHQRTSVCSEKEHPCPVKKILATKEPQRMEHIHYDRFKRKRYVEVLCSPVFDEEGNVVQIIESLNDITERKIAEISLKENAEKYKLLFHNANDAIFLHGITEEGNVNRFIDINNVACERLGYSRTELLKMSPNNIDAPEFTKETQEIMKELQAKKQLTFEGVHLTKTGDRIPVEISSHIFKLKEEEVVCSIVRDISARKGAEVAEKARTKERTFLLDIITHDLRNYQAVAGGFLGIFDPDLGELKTKDLEKAKAAIIRTNQLLENVSIMMERDMGIEYDLVPVNILKSLKKIDLTLKELFPNRDINIKVEDISEEYFVLADNLFDHLLLNLLTNAIKNDNKKIININGKLETLNKNKCILSITDFGKGIPPNNRDMIFKKYNMIGRKSGGTGLGLHIVKTLSNRYNGKVWIENRIPKDYSKGTTFKIELDLA